MFLLLLLLFPLIMFSQQPDTSEHQQKTDFFNGGFIDIIQTGQVSASTRLFRLYIGEPGKFQVPFSIFSGVSANNLLPASPDRDILNILVNPGAGLLNLMFEGTNLVVGKKNKITGVHLQYHTSMRLLSVLDQNIDRNICVFNCMSSVGVMFVTGAWERDRMDNIGFFWINFRILISDFSRSAFRSLYNQPLYSELFVLSGGMGVEINKALNLKLVSFKVLNNQQEKMFTYPLVQLSFNYSL